MLGGGCNNKSNQALITRFFSPASASPPPVASLEPRPGPSGVSAGSSGTGRVQQSLSPPSVSTTPDSHPDSLISVYSELPMTPPSPTISEADTVVLPKENGDSLSDDDLPLFLLSNQYFSNINIQLPESCVHIHHPIYGKCHSNNVCILLILILLYLRFK